MHSIKLRKKNLSSRRWSAFLAALVMMIATVSSMTGRAQAVFILTGVEDTAIVLTNGDKAPDLSQYLLDMTAGSKGHDLTIPEGKTVILRHNGAIHRLQSQGEKVSELLKQLSIVPSPLEMIAVDMTETAAIITVAEEITYYDKIVETTPYTTRRTVNYDLPQGTEQVVQVGMDGVRGNVYEVTWANGKEISRQFVEAVDTAPVEEIIEYGTAVSAVDSMDRIAEVITHEDGSGTLVFQSGVTMNFSDAKSMTATAYTAGHGGADYTTATGTFVRVGTVAVDKRVIPLGTRMYIVTDSGIVYGMGVAEDTGVKGNKVDLYHETYEQCINFGRRSCTVYILE